MSEDLDSVLTDIDVYFSRKYHIHMLKFLANSVVSYGLLETCTSVPQVYTKIKQSRILRDHDDSVAVALLRHMLHVTGYKKEKINLLDPFCCSEDVKLTTVAPSLPFYEVLLLLASKLVKNDHYRDFLASVDEILLNRSRHDISSPLELFQSMILQGTLDPKTFSTLSKVLEILGTSQEMREELMFMQDSIQRSNNVESDDDEAFTVSVAIYYNHKGLPDSNNRQGIDYECMNAFWMLQERSSSEAETPSLPTSYSDLDISSKIVYQKCGRCCTGFSACTMLLLIVGTALTFSLFLTSSSTELNHVQPVYLPRSLAYASFPQLDQFFYPSIEMFVNVDQRDDLRLYNLTVCKLPCPLAVNITHSQVNGVCPATRAIANCFVDVFGHSDHSTIAQDYSRYMLRNSTMTLVITEPPKSQNATVLCITIDKDKCSQMFFAEPDFPTADCNEVLVFNSSNNYTRTFTAKSDSYYCAVWLLSNETLALSYTLNTTLRSYQMPVDHRSRSKCQNFQDSNFKNKTHVFSLRHGIALKRHDYTCILMQQSGENLNHNVTVSSKAVFSAVSNIAFVFGILLAIILVLTILFVAICHQRML